jgi:enamine deaminase RidA (YjgF/YER057c/UK114 family)
LRELGLILPEVPKPLANYVPTVRVGELVFAAGQGSRQPEHAGKLGKELSVEEGYQSARQAMLYVLGALKAEIGDLNKVEQVVKVTGFVASAEGFKDQPKVLNGASDLLVEIFGEKGRHARAAVGVNELPLGCSVEVEAIFRVR